MPASIKFLGQQSESLGATTVARFFQHSAAILSKKFGYLGTCNIFGFFLYQYIINMNFNILIFIYLSIFFSNILFINNLINNTTKIYRKNY